MISHIIIIIIMVGCTTSLIQLFDKVQILNFIEIILTKSSFIAEYFYKSYWLYLTKIIRQI